MRKDGVGDALRSSEEAGIVNGQYFDTLKSIGESDKTSTLFLAHSSGSVKEVSDQILESMLVAQNSIR